MRCNRCGVEILYKGSGRYRHYCVDCSRLVHLAYMRNYMYNKRLGTSDFSEYANTDDFDVEYVECHKELVKKKFKRQFT